MRTEEAFAPRGAMGIACLVLFGLACSGGGGGDGASGTGFGISGTVTGAPAVTISLVGGTSATTTTDAGGRYAFTGLSNGSYDVTPSKAGYAFSPASIAVTLSGASVTGRDFAATPTGCTNSCYGGYYLDPSTCSCLAPQCYSDAACGPRGSCDPASYQCQCPVGEHPCGATCVHDDSIDTCGTSCAPCPAAPNAPTAPITCEPDSYDFYDNLYYACSYACPAGQIHCTGGCCTATSVSVGADHACAMTSNGGVSCWGASQFGETGSLLDRWRPTDVPNLSSGVTLLAAGKQHNCALVNGAVSCWGSNGSGELGLGTSDGDPHSSPVQVTGAPTGITGLAATKSWGEAYTFAIASQTLYCWGYYWNGSNGYYLPRTVDITGSTGVTTGADVAAAAQVGAVLRTDSTIGAWDGYTGAYGGANFYPVSDVLTSTQPATLLAGASEVAATRSGGCALVAGEIWCWTAGVDGLGGATRLVGLSGVTQLVAGEDHYCALVNGGGVQCWGGNELGQLGNGTFSSSTAPVAVTGLSSGVTEISAGGWTTCALLTSGALVCWGSNGSGELGNGQPDRTAPYGEPTPVGVSNR